MYARSTTVHADPQRIDDGIALVRDEVMPTMQDMPGCVGLSMMCDRESGRCIATTSWDSKDVDDRQPAKAYVPCATAPWTSWAAGWSVQEWEIAVLHRAHRAPDGAACRVTWTRGDPAGMDAMIESFRMSIDAAAGRHARVLQPEHDGRPALRDESSLTAVYNDRAPWSAPRRPDMSMRDEFTAQTGLEMMDMAEFEMAIHRLRVPEMA